MAGVNYETRDEIAVLTLDNPPVNGLGQAVRQGLQDGIDKALADDAVKAVVITGAGRMFSAGADIREFGAPPAEPFLPAVLDRIELADKPVVAAVFGVAAGGGLELALACHWRIAAAKTRVGLPEVTLGIIPGAGGTQRLPRLIGVKDALEMIVQGNLIPVDNAHALGVVDAVVDGDAVDAAVDFAKSKAGEGAAPRRIRDMAAEGDRKMLDGYREGMQRKLGGFEAPWVAADLVAATLETSFEDGMKREREAFAKLVVSDQSKALRHAFFAEREAAKIPDLPRDTKPRPVAKAGVIGAGTMGGGIAMNFANVGIPVTVLEIERAALDRGFGVIERNYANTVSRGRLSEEDMQERMSRLAGTTSYDDLADADIIIEAVFEDMDVKKTVFAELDRVAKDGAVLATNTSTLDVDEIASATKRPEDVIGTHFFSPANVMKLMENVRGAKSSPETIATVMELGKRINKVPVLVGVCFGFVGNRMLYAYTRQAGFLLEEGALPQQVDKVIRDFGFPMGPFQMGDLAGLDVGHLVRKAHPEILAPEGMRYSDIGDRLAEMGRHGQKTGRGWYIYEEGNRQGRPDPEVEEMIVETSKAKGIERREISDREILERCMFPLVNEGARILEEGIAIRPSDIDVVWLYGYGFPRYRGGPMFWADQIGLATVLETMKRFHNEVGEWCTPAPLLERLVEEGRSFADLAA